MPQQFTVEEIGAGIKARNPGKFDAYTDAQVGQRAVDRNPGVFGGRVKAAAAVPVTPERKLQNAQRLGELQKEQAAGGMKARSTASFLPRAVADIFTGSSQKFGTTLGTAGAVASGATGKMDAASVSEADSRFRLAKLLNDPKTTPEQKANIRRQLGMGPSVGVATEQVPELNQTNRQVLGQGIGTVLEMTSGGSLSGKVMGSGRLLKGAAPLGLKPSIVAPTIMSGVKKGAAVGAAYGGIGGAAQAMQENKTVGGIATNAAFGAFLAAGVGGALGGIANIPAAVARRNMEKSAQKSLLMSKAPDSTVATKKLVGNKVVTDEVAKEAVNLGVDPADVALVKSASSADKSKMAKMLDIRASQLTNKRVMDRATDVVGDSVLEQARYIEKVNKSAGRALNAEAQKLKGVTVDPTDSVRQFATDLSETGVTLDKDGNLNYTGSDFKGLKSIQSSIDNVWDSVKDMTKETPDGYRMHQLKRQIDEAVEYGRKQEGLSGKSERILKNFRRAIDGTLDSQFAGYKAENDIFSETVGVLDEIKTVMGRNQLSLPDEFAATKAGVTMRRVMSNVQSRAELMNLIESMLGTARKYGYKESSDVITQALFADTLEKILGTEAPTSLLGQAARSQAGREAASGVSDIAMGGARGKVTGGA